ncbi:MULTISPECIES: MarR family winged helix-turn-helix transcriptional regulator [Bacillus]|uniref:MarR family winged helix-turn-helix transcriptional regulator n=1 Tax=Bacillus TaxID=1386 RepID=UPI001581F2A4|nr:MarR family transcriptional regulator [Bacillus glycinifermentans]MBU8785827.1 MarR family transcriptional regulator [Bacillus glycinifermentans]NUJ15637.1 MarR family transcriptional regulator [Bacillus glycinifermentans]
MKEKIAKEYIELIPNVFAGFSELNKDATGLTHMQNHVIEFMYMQKRALNMKDISTGLNIAKQQLTNVIGSLEADGYVTKAPDPKDKRAVLVSLTSLGKGMVEKKWTRIYETFSGNLNKLSDEELIDLHFALHKANVLLKKMED